MDDSTINCPSCERGVDDSLTWCPYCGAELASGPSPGTSAAGEPASGHGGTTVAPVVVRGPGPMPGAAPDGAGRSPAALVAVGLVAALVIGAAAVWFLVLRGDDGDLSVMEAAPGDCFDEPGESGLIGEFSDLPRVACSGPHDYEVFAVVRVPGEDGAAYPGEDALFLEGLAGCVGAFQGYTGVPYAASPLDATTLFPTPESWGVGDREVICSLARLDGAPLEASQRGSGLRMPVTADDFAGAASCTDLAAAALGVAQATIDVLDSYTEEELAELFASAEFPEEMIPLAKEETLMMVRAADLGCSLAEIDALVISRAGVLTAETDHGRAFADEIAATGFFSTG